MPRDELLAGNYTVSGPAGLVDHYLEGKTVITQNNLGGLKTACLQGTPDDQKLTSGLEIGSVNLQDYFISLMNGEEEIS
jgi:ABC-2 type transport system ATP-binding protein